jgi:hypothetical protein
MEEQKSYPNKLDECCTDEQIAEHYKAKCAKYEQDALFALYFSLNRKGNEIAAILNDTQLYLGDKNFDQFLKLIEKIDPLASALNKLRLNYLNIGEEALEGQSKKGVPLIEEARSMASQKVKKKQEKPRR